jgi:hypothetical protein
MFVLLGLSQPFSPKAEIAPRANEVNSCPSNRREARKSAIG